MCYLKRFSDRRGRTCVGTIPPSVQMFHLKGGQSTPYYHLVPTLWNDLHLAVRESECRNTFKNRLDMANVVVQHWKLSMATTASAVDALLLAKVPLTI